MIKPSLPLKTVVVISSLRERFRNFSEDQSLAIISTLCKTVLCCSLPEIANDVSSNIWSKCHHLHVFFFMWLAEANFQFSKGYVRNEPESKTKHKGKVVNDAKKYIKNVRLPLLYRYISFPLSFFNVSVTCLAQPLLLKYLFIWKKKLSIQSRFNRPV